MNNQKTLVDQINTLKETIKYNDMANIRLLTKLDYVEERIGKIDEYVILIKEENKTFKKENELLKKQDKHLEDNRENKIEYFKPEFKFVVKKKDLGKLAIVISTNKVCFEIDTEFTIKGVDFVYIVVSKGYDIFYLSSLASKVNLKLWIDSSIDIWMNL